VNSFHPAFEDGTDTGFQTSANYNLTPGKYPEENIQYSNHGESLKSRTDLHDCENKQKNYFYKKKINLAVGVIKEAVKITDRT